MIVKEIKINDASVIFYDDYFRDRREEEVNISYENIKKICNDIYVHEYMKSENENMNKSKI